MADWPAKYTYDKANRVGPGKFVHMSEPCFAYMRDARGGGNGEEWFTLPVVMDPDVAKAYLELIKKEVPFEYEFNAKRSQVAIKWPEMSFKHAVIFGNLCKGVSEYAFFCEKILETQEDKPFFERTLDAFRMMTKNDLMAVGYNESHGWFRWNDLKEDPKMKSKTVKEVYDRIKSHTKGFVWNHCLRHQSDGYYYG